MQKLIQNLRLLEIYARKRQALQNVPETQHLSALIKNQLLSEGIPLESLGESLAKLDLHAQLRYAVLELTAENPQQQLLAAQKLAKLQVYIHKKDVKTSVLHVLVDEVLIAIYGLKKDAEWRGFRVLEEVRSGARGGNYAAYERLLQIVKQEL
ncbi:hypothetical protein SS50377_21906 [Spironucleus salmonicida]|uniref:Uncharacterized protein n=1 Tax=Spironucleus salmonicida TaxID=348837 RepID=V6LL29_9EUKA|nr:hypothetical protein SS50377_21906 [Spironucleus salmonicida]|eukprot:EST44446.1 Hypothetical protein SS50377_15754 [Spironucleus salmonicida]